MTAQFWYGLLALPALLIILGLAVIIPYGALWLIDYSRAWRIRRANKARKFTHEWAGGAREFVADDDGRLKVAAAFATSENFRYAATPFGVIAYGSGRWDRKAAHRLRLLLEADLLRDDSERGMEPK